MKNISIEFKELTKSYEFGKFDTKHFFKNILKKNSEVLNALDNVSLKVYSGEKVAIIGYNGAGKSTLLKIISKITYPTKGYVCVNGRVSSLLEAGVGFHTELNGIEIIYLSGSILGMTRKEIDKQLNNIIEFSEFSKKQLSTPVKRYSTGEIIKLAISVVMYLDAEIIILDEIIAVVDKKFREKCMQKILEFLKDKKKTLLFVSHQLDIVKNLCERSILIENGKIILDDKTEKVINFYTTRNKNLLK